VFKQYTGITPTEYRELAWNRNKETENESLIPLKADG
jgi:AraC-like DNA-binding protein